jgi:hypothetical protein
MLRFRIDRGVYVRPWTVIDGWSGGCAAVCACVLTLKARVARVRANAVNLVFIFMTNYLRT